APPPTPRSPSPPPPGRVGQAPPPPHRRAAPPPSVAAVPGRGGTAPPRRAPGAPPAHPPRAGRPDGQDPRSPAGAAAGRRRRGPLPGQPVLRRGAAGRRPPGAQVPSALGGPRRARAGALSEEAQQVLGVAAAAGSRVDPQLLATVAAMPEQRLLGLLREAVT